jgi:uncharacterized coiled-coil DUF342 family protein
MSYAICRVQKIKGASAVHGVQGHQRRERESNSNPDIDYSRKNLNYSLLSEEKENNKSFNALADERIKQGYTGKKAIRKDAVKLVSALFTSDNDFFQGKPPYEQRKYLEDCYAWACERWGKDNIISAVVHMDEQTPHLHIEFVPLTADGRLSAYNVLGGRVDLQRMQDNFYSKVGKPWGLERGERADFEDPKSSKPRKHLETAALKQKTVAEVKKLEDKRDKLSEECIQIAEKRTETARKHTEISMEYITLSEKKNALNDEIRGLQNQKNKISDKLDDTNAEYDVAVGQLRNVLDKKARASEIHKIFGDKETQTYHVNMLDSTRAIGYEAYRNLQKAKEKLEKASKMKNEAERISSEIKPLHEKATAELQQAQQLRQNQEQQIQRQAQILFEKKLKDAFHKNSDNRTKRLETLCKEIKFNDGRTVLDIFKEKEDLLKKQLRKDDFNRGGTGR